MDNKYNVSLTLFLFGLLSVVFVFFSASPAFAADYNSVRYNNTAVWYKITDNSPELVNTEKTDKTNTEEQYLDTPSVVATKKNIKYAINAGSTPHTPIFDGNNWIHTFYSEGREWYDVLLMTKDGELKSFPHGTPLNILQKEEPLWCIGGFDTIIKNGIVQKPTLAGSGTVAGLAKDKESVATKKHPRTFIGQLNDNSFFFGVSSGRGKDGNSEGFTYNDLIAFVTTQIAPISEIKLLFNLDGGGTSAFVYEGQKVNDNYDTKTGKERVCSSLFAFNDTYSNNTKDHVLYVAELYARSLIFTLTSGLYNTTFPHSDRLLSLSITL